MLHDCHFRLCAPHHERILIIMMDEHDPIYLAEFAAQCVVSTQLPKFTPESIHLLDSYALHRDTRENRAIVVNNVIAMSCAYGVCVSGGNCMQRAIGWLL